jgi:hypothetical protein
VVKKFENVEELLDNMAEYDGRWVQASGEAQIAARRMKLPGTAE